MVEEIEVVKVSRLVQVIWVVEVIEGIINEILNPISTQMMADMMA